MTAKCNNCGKDLWLKVESKLALTDSPDGRDMARLNHDTAVTHCGHCGWIYAVERLSTEKPLREARA